MKLEEYLEINEATGDRYLYIPVKTTDDLIDYLRRGIEAKDYKKSFTKKGELTPKYIIRRIKAYRKNIGKYSPFAIKIDISKLGNHVKNGTVEPANLPPLEKFIKDNGNLRDEKWGVEVAKKIFKKFDKYYHPKIFKYSTLLDRIPDNVMYEIRHNELDKLNPPYDYYFLEKIAEYYMKTKKKIGTGEYINFRGDNLPLKKDYASVVLNKLPYFADKEQPHAMLEFLEEYKDFFSEADYNKLKDYAEKGLEGNFKAKKYVSLGNDIKRRGKDTSVKSVIAKDAAREKNGLVNRNYSNTSRRTPPRRRRRY